MQNANIISLFGLPILNTSQWDAVAQLLDGDAPQTAAFVNAHCVNTAYENSSYRWALDRTDIILPDGSGLQMAARMQGKSFMANLNGTDLFLPLCRGAAERGQSIYFFGSSDGVAAAAAARATELVPELEVAGTRHGYFSASEEAGIIDEINRSGASIVLVALGVPMQEIWISRNRHRLSARIIMGVGAQFDFWSGRVRRAPLLLRKGGLEWCWRLMLEPRRLARRYVIGNPLFIARALRARRDNGMYEIFGKRLLDLLGSGLALLALAPILVIIALAVRLTSSGPVLFRQQRVGYNGETFELLKFRSMYRDADARRTEVLKQSDRQGVCFKARRDPRITPIGRWLRRFSLDELPQLINVWRGEMSLVGPRPALPGEVAAYPPHARERLSRKPGITGLWQVAGRAEIDFARMIEMDRAYVRSTSLWLDIVLLALTIRAVIGGRGAY
ncbi:WecB/TagA/CpsF family glycosyltransferase [Agrobacterium salinitolerans]